MSSASLCAVSFVDSLDTTGSDKLRSSAAAVAAGVGNESRLISLLARSPDAASRLVRERVVEAGKFAADAATERLLNSSCRCLAVFDDSFIVETVAKAFVAARSNNPQTKLYILGNAKLAKTVASAGVSVEYAPLAAAGVVLSRSQVVLFGAEAVYGDGRLLVANKVAPVVALAADIGVETLAVVQTIKFTQDVVLADVDREDMQLLRAQFVDTIVTEQGQYRPQEALRVFKLHGML